MSLAVPLMVKRVNTSLSDDLFEEIDRAALEIGVTKADLFAGLLTLWARDDQGLRERVIEPARENRQEALRRQFRRRDK